MSIRVVARALGTVEEAQRQDFMAIVRAGGEVSDASLGRNTREAERLVFARQGGSLVGVAALKNPQPHHRATIKQKAGVAVEVMDFPFELGYIFVLPCARRGGLATKLCRSALRAANGRGVFATARTDNVGIHRILRRLRFQKVGIPFSSTRGIYKLQLFLRK